MSASKGGGAPYSPHRMGLQPRLVHLICGLRVHQVEEAVGLLLDYIDCGAASPEPQSCGGEESRSLAAIKRAVADYHLALDIRTCGGVAANTLVSEIESILATPWIPGQELNRRKGPAS